VNEERVYTAKEVCTLLRLDPSTLRRWVDAELVVSSARTGGSKPRRRYTDHDLLRARVVQSLLSVPLRGKRLRVAVARTMGALGR
jgi:DNA-binding transcriptional MerR regulator